VATVAHVPLLLALAVLGMSSCWCSERESRRAEEADGTQCQFKVPDGVEVTVRGVPHPFEIVELGDGSAHVRLFNPKKVQSMTPPLPLLGRGHHDFEIATESGEVWLQFDRGEPKLVALELRSTEPWDAKFLSFAWNRSPALPAARLAALTGKEAQGLAALRIQADAYEVPDLSRFERLSAVELEFTRPYWSCSADDLQEGLSPNREADAPFTSPRSTCLSSILAVAEPTPEKRLALQQELAAHTPSWIAHAKEWLQELPETVEYLRLTDVPFEALEALPSGIEHLELVGVYGTGPEISLQNVPGALRTLVVEQLGRVRVDGLEGLRELKLRGAWIDEKDVARLRQLEKFASDSARLGTLLEHPSLREVDLRKATIDDWFDVYEAVEQTNLRRLVLTDARTPQVGELDPKLSSGVVLHTTLDELRSALRCATKIVVRDRHELCVEERPSNRPQPSYWIPSSIPSLAVVRSLLVDARPGAGHRRSCDMPVLDVYHGSAFVLTLDVTEDCRTLSSDLWGSGVSLTGTAARRLCTWLNHQRGASK
jgi:hypothetical protein